MLCFHPPPKKNWEGKEDKGIVKWILMHNFKCKLLAKGYFKVLIFMEFSLHFVQRMKHENNLTTFIKEKLNKNY